MSQVLQVLEIFEIRIYQIFESFWPRQMTSTHIKQLEERYGDGNNNRVYLNITDRLYNLVHVIIRLDGYQR